MGNIWTRNAPEWLGGEESLESRTRRYNEAEAKRMAEVDRKSWDRDPDIKPFPSQDDAFEAARYKRAHGDPNIQAIDIGDPYRRETGRGYWDRFEQTQGRGDLAGKPKPPVVMQPTNPTETDYLRQGQLAASQMPVTYGRFDPKNTSISVRGVQSNYGGFSDPFNKPTSMWAESNRANIDQNPSTPAHELGHLAYYDLYNNVPGAKDIILGLDRKFITHNDAEQGFGVHELLTRGNLQRNFGPDVEGTVLKAPPPEAKPGVKVSYGGGRGQYQQQRTYELMKNPEVIAAMRKLERMGAERGAKSLIDRQGMVYADGGAVPGDELSIDYPTIEHSSVLPAHEERPENTHGLLGGQHPMGMSYRAGGRVKIPLGKPRKFAKTPGVKRYERGGSVEEAGIEDAVNEATQFVPLERAYTGLGDETNNRDVVDRLRHPSYQQLADDKDLRRGRTRMAPRGRGNEGGFGYEDGGRAIDTVRNPMMGYYPQPEQREPLSGNIGRAQIELNPSYVPEQNMGGSLNIRLPVGNEWNVGVNAWMDRYIGRGYEDTKVPWGAGVTIGKKFRAGGAIRDDGPEPEDIENDDWERRSTIHKGYKPGREKVPGSNDELEEEPRAHREPLDTSEFETPQSDTYDEVEPQWMQQEGAPDPGPDPARKRPWVPNYRKGGKISGPSPRTRALAVSRERSLLQGAGAVNPAGNPRRR
jgi:hypothetical protein